MYNWLKGVCERLFSGAPSHDSINGHKQKCMKIHLTTKKHFHCGCGHNQGQIAMRGLEVFICGDIEDLSGHGLG